MESIAERTLPNSMGFDWTGMSYQEKKVGGESILIFLFAVVLVYLVLAAQYESWITPAAVILVVPLGVLGAIAAVAYRGMDNNIYTQIGIVLIIALASKNAILIVEYARELRLEGRSILESAIEAARLRFRPIIMTSFAFIMGVFPLVIADGAGAVVLEAQTQKGAREDRGILSSVIRSDGRYEDLPGQAYAIGFVRAYADHLGLDGDEVVRRYKEESSGVKRKAAYEFPLPTADSGDRKSVV